MSKVIVQMIVKNEADRYLEEVLDHTKSFADEIVITDDGSTDNTVEIARKYTDNVYENETSLFAINEGMLRQKAWDNIYTHARTDDLILCLDADEKLFINGYDLNALADTNYKVFGITFYHMWNNSEYRVDKAWAPVISSRLFRYREGGQFSDRRLACGSEPSYIQRWIKRGYFFLATGLAMQHLGYMRDEDKQAKYERYMELDKGEFHSRAHLESILDPNPTLVSWEETLDKLKAQPRKVIRYGNNHTNRYNRYR